MAELRNLSKVIQYRDEKANIEALDAVLEEISFAFATDTEELGIYTNGDWFWISTGGESGGSSHTHGLARWNGASSQTTFDLPDVAEYVDSVKLNGLEEDPSVYSLSADGTQIILDTALASATTVTANYVIATV